MDKSINNIKFILFHLPTFIKYNTNLRRQVIVN